ncbi:B-cell antigen receptor complex-associated protein alpha chain [Takifugu rubripes]|uniref:B-cell antigen receptor complex-associated protein alpha chain n=1 Tax=Takifugu rubripes TaxID=31033 RepID=UPI001145E202|nr:B-cell antigen receptor complex-associated protein alpha chain [Takifugu rubripes]
MWTLTNVFFCSLAVVVAQEEVTLEADKPYLRVRLHGVAEVECCYTSAEPLTATWVRRNGTRGNKFLNPSDHVTKGSKNMGTTKCSMLVLKSVELSDAGLYQCLLNNSNTEQLSYGTYLHVYIPIHKMLTISERTKNNILTAEGILLLLFVLLPATTILFKNKRQYELEKKKVTRESENIYQGLNLDECCPKYDQIERSHDHGPYQDVCNASDEEEFHLEKP